MCIKLRVLHEEPVEVEFDSALLMKLTPNDLGKLYAPVKKYFRETYGATVSMTVVNSGEDRKFDFIYHDDTPSSFDLRRLLRVFGIFMRCYVEGGFRDVKTYKDRMASLIPLIDRPDELRKLLEVIDGYKDVVPKPS